MKTDAFLKYPRTPHIQGSRLQPGDEDLEGLPYAHRVGHLTVLEEKLDGANAALSFDEDGCLRLQSRGHYLTGGHRERHFELFKSWACTVQRPLWERLGCDHIVFGEWLYAKHTIYYDLLPHYFLEFDVYDRKQQIFLSTRARQQLLQGLPVASVPVLWQGPLPQRSQLNDWVKPALYKSDQWWQHLAQQASQLGLDPQRSQRETDPSPLSEGLYLKFEDSQRVVDRAKFVRGSFLSAVIDSESHWLDRPILPNQLAPGVDIFAC